MSEEPTNPRGFNEKMIVAKIFLLFSFFFLVYSKNTCIDGFYEKEGLCWACSPNCETCNGPEEDSCTRCPKYSKRWGSSFDDIQSGGTFLCATTNQKDMVSITESESRCSTGKFFDEEIERCVPCHPTCRTCLGSGPQNCSSCLEDQFASSGSKDSVGVNTFSCLPRCHNEGRKLGEFSECPVVSNRKARELILPDIDTLICGEREFLKDFKCHPCPENCTQCDEHGCLSCSSNFFNEIYMDEVKLKYVRCVKNCSGISIPNSDGSTTCLVKKPCETGYYRDDEYNCMPCVESSQHNCTTCASGYYKLITALNHSNFTCVKKCPPTYYAASGECLLCAPHCATCNGSSNNCRTYHCHYGCSTCNGTGSNQCFTCYKGFFKTNPSSAPGIYECAQDCPMYHYKSNDSCLPCLPECKTCENGNSCTSFKCHPSCSSCNAPFSDKCTRCSDTYLRMREHGSGDYTFNCTRTCPNNRYQSGWDCLLCDPSCKTCSGPTNRHCTSCDYGKVLTSAGRSRYIQKCSYPTSTSIYRSTKSAWNKKHDDDDKIRPWDNVDKPYYQTTPRPTHYWNNPTTSTYMGFRSFWDYTTYRNYYEDHATTLIYDTYHSRYQFSTGWSVSGIIKIIVITLLSFIALEMLVYLVVKIRARRTSNTQVGYQPIHYSTSEEIVKPIETSHPVQNI